MCIIFIYLDRPNSTSVLFQRSFHKLGLFCDLPNPNLSFSSTRNDSLSIRSGCNWGTSMIVGIIDNIKKLPWLWQKSSNFSIRPSWNYWFSIMHKSNTIALQAWYLNSQQLLSVFRIPYSNFIDWCCSKNIWVIEWKSDVINLLIMAGIS